MTRLFIGAFVRVKVGTAFLSGGRPRESLCERFARRGAGRGGGGEGGESPVSGCLG